ncbi:MAG: hypothetical protein Q9192_003073 [Flavoplaca navasiana]
MRPLYGAVARVVLHRPLWLASTSPGDCGAERNPYPSHVRRQYWWSAQNSPDVDPKATTTRGDESDSREASSLTQYLLAQQSTTKVPRRIYILGIGNVGGFVAHSLASLPHPPPITLLLYNQKQLSAWHEQGRSIKLTTHGLLDTKLGFEVESVRQPDSTTEYPSTADVSPQLSGPPDADIIHNLVLSVKAYHTVNALKQVAHRLRPESSILFLQNGMGIIEEVNEQIFPNPEQRPQYLLGIISHGVYSVGPFSIVHAGAGTIAMAIIPRNIEEIKPASAPSALYLLRTLTRSPVLAAVGFSPTDLLQLQLEKLAVNAIINPLTALYNCVNGGLLRQPSVSRVMRLLLAEISLVIKSLPELEGVPNLSVRFDIRRLEGEVIGIATKTAVNRSSTLEDVRRGGPTEMEYLTGYIVRRGEQVGLQCVMNYMMKHLVLAKEKMRRDRRQRLLPIDKDDVD